MKKFIALAFIMGLSATATQAMPLVPNQGTASMITKIAGGCGPGFYRGPRGGCIREGGTVVVVPGAVVVVPKTGPCGGRGQHEVCVVGRGCRWVCN